MNKLIVFSNYDDIHNPFYAGGGASAIHEIGKRLTSKYRVKVLTGKYPGARNETLEGIDYERVGLSFAGPRLGQVFFHFCLPWQVRRIMFDLWIESLTPPFSTACLQLFTRRPVALLTQNLPGKAMARKYKLPFHWVEGLGLKTYRYGIALSAPIRDELLKANRHMQVAIIPNGVDPKWIAQPVENHGEYILSLGRIDIQQKGLDLLLEAFKMTAAHCNVPLVIAGCGTEQEERHLKSRVNALGLKERVRIVGKVGGEKKEEMFRRAMFLVMPSRFEGFPLTLLEAFCWQLPVVFFSIPELAWLPDPCCVKIPPFDVTAFGSAMAALAMDRDTCIGKGKAAKIWVRGFGWDVLAENYEKFFASVLAPC